MEEEKLLKPAKVAQYLDTTPGALAQKRYLGTGPKFIKLGGRSVRYRESDVRAWVAEQTRSQTGHAA